MAINRAALVGATALVSLTSPLVAHAQSAPAKATVYDLSEVVVVAQRRSERLIDVPISVTALQADELAAAGVTRSTDLTTVTPGLNMTTTGNYVQPTIRGIGSNIANPSAESNVATYVDGAYQASLVAATLDLPDVESIQVLKGPQGTLFGRNATGGAILINTKQANLSELEGNVSLSYGNYNSLVAKGYVTAPIIQDKMAFSLAGLYDTTDGWKTNLNNGSKDDAWIRTYLLRAKLRFIPWEGADFTLSASYSLREDQSTSKTSLYQGNSLLRSPPLSFLFPSAVFSSEPWTFSQDAPASTRKERVSFGLHGDIDAGPGKISTTTYYDRSNSVLLADVDNTSAPAGVANIFGAPKTFSQELLYTTDQIGKFRAVGGLYYFQSKIPNGTILQGLLGNLGIYSRDKAKSSAAFGEVTYDVTDKLSLTGGLRYSSEKRTSNAVRATTNISITPDQFFYPEDLSKTWHSWTPRISALYNITERTNLYATFSKGFTSGLFNTTSFQTDPVNPEKVAAYEIGLKSNELRNLSFSMAGFWYDYTDLQTSHTEFQPVLHNEVTNAAKARIKGIEVNAQWRATEYFDISTGWTYMDAKYKDFPNALVLVPIPLPGGGFGGNSQVIPLPNIGGTRMIRTPKFSGNLTGHYHQAFAMGELDASATLFYSSKLFWDYGERVPQDSYTLLSGSIGWKPEGTNVKVSVWGKNLTDKKVLSSGSFVAPLYDTVDYLAPQTYGVALQYDF